MSGHANDPVTFDPATDEFHVVQLSSVIFYISATTRKEIEALMRHASSPWETLTIETLDGSEVMVVVDAVNVMWSTSPASRDRERAITEAISETEL